MLTSRADEQSCNPIANAHYPLCMGEEGQGPGQEYAIKAVTIKEASCGQKLLKLLDEQVLPTRGKRQHLQRCCMLSCQ